MGSLKKPSPPDRAASARDVADRALPVFSATGRIPFAENAGASPTGAGAVQAMGGGSRLKDEMDVDSDGRKFENVWEVPETPDK